MCFQVAYLSVPDELAHRDMYHGAVHRICTCGRPMGAPSELGGSNAHATLWNFHWNAQDHVGHFCLYLRFRCSEPVRPNRCTLASIT